MITEVGQVDFDVPRDRDSSFEPATVKKRQRRLNGVDSMVISLQRVSCRQQLLISRNQEGCENFVRDELVQGRADLQPFEASAAIHVFVPVNRDLAEPLPSLSDGSDPEALQTVYS